MATTVGTQANILGIMTGYLLPIIFVDNYSQGSPLSDSYKSQIFNMLIAVSIFATFIALLVIVSFRSKPDAQFKEVGGVETQENQNEVTTEVSAAGKNQVQVQNASIATTNASADVRADISGVYTTRVLTLME